ncbi:hypothetical protein DPMN_060953 [Dreissena polymorpha]|uniref:Uncharacterized protein n=1 Tax=Dreissena polymorpha TaxID=45954 RepID=A0A9D4C716_DREPO|nr:hypothetical protein DPMN_060953 [Dreissena polymorpha]
MQGDQARRPKDWAVMIAISIWFQSRMADGNEGVSIQVYSTEWDQEAYIFPTL